MSYFRCKQNIDTSQWGYRWEAVVTESRSSVEIPQGDMEQVRQNTLIKWNRALINLGRSPKV